MACSRHVSTSTGCQPAMMATQASLGRNVVNQVVSVVGSYISSQTSKGPLPKSHAPQLASLTQERRPCVMPVEGQGTVSRNSLCTSGEGG